METAAKWLVDLFEKADPQVQFAILVILLLVLGFLVWREVRNWLKIRELKLQRDELRHQLRVKELQATALETKLDDKEKRIDQLQEASKDHAEKVGKVSQQLSDTKDELQKTQLQHNLYKNELEALQKRFDDLQKIDSDVWIGPVSDGSEVAQFISPRQRKTRFVVFLNLKGGVGKTTLVANLAAAYSTGITGAQLRLLAIDLDYQGTMSTMCVRRDFAEERRATRKTSSVLITDDDPTLTTQDLLAALMAPFEGTEGRSKVIVADDGLDHIDFRQQARFAVEHREVRFLHRRILHDEFVVENFDFVFFDCPPRLTTSSVNALAAADFIVIPTSLHPNDVEAVPRTLRWLEKLQALPNFQAKVAAVVLNRTYRKGAMDDLTDDEKQQLPLLERHVQQFQPVPGVIMEHLIPNSPLVARFAAGSMPLGIHPQGHDIYRDVAVELHRRMRG